MNILTKKSVPSLVTSHEYIPRSGIIGTESLTFLRLWECNIKLHSRRFTSTYNPNCNTECLLSPSVTYGTQWWHSGLSLNFATCSLGGTWNQPLLLSWFLVSSHNLTPNKRAMRKTSMGLREDQRGSERAIPVFPKICITMYLSFGAHGCLQRQFWTESERGWGHHSGYQFP